MTLRPVLTLYLAHLLTDFIFQTSHLVQQKNNGRVIGYFKHGAIHYICALLTAVCFLPGAAFALRFQLVVIGLTLVHLLIDFCKTQLSKSHIAADSALAFIVDQFAHVITVVWAACLIEQTPLTNIARGSLRVIHQQSDRILFLLIVYVLVIFACGYLIRLVTRPLMRHIGLVSPHTHDSPPRETPAQLSNAGMYIGWLERFLVLTALLLHSPATDDCTLARRRSRPACLRF